MEHARGCEEGPSQGEHAYLGQVSRFTNGRLPASPPPIRRSRPRFCRSSLGKPTLTARPELFTDLVKRISIAFVGHAQ